jgi:hypothetical protein
MRLKLDTFDNVKALAGGQGLRTGPFATHVMETIGQCPPERFHAAMAAFLDEAKRGR